MADAEMDSRMADSAAQEAFIFLSPCGSYPAAALRGILAKLSGTM
jgi:hypothetical protein